MITGMGYGLTAAPPTVAVPQPPPKYSWVMMVADGKSAGGLTIAQPVVAGNQSARESSGNYHVPRGAVVRITFVGYDEADEPVYVFSYADQDDPFAPVAPHDHRDLSSGGFAFAVYHPGTAIPQQRWAI